MITIASLIFPASFTKLYAPICFVACPDARTLVMRYTINFYDVDKKLFLVDLPGYGYAKRSKSQTEQLQEIISDYVLRREQMTLLFVLVDSRHEPQKIDLEFMEMLATNGIPFAIIFTKLDKLSIRQWQNNLKAYKARLEQDWEELPPIFATSAEKGIGREEILNYINDINNSLKNGDE